MLLIATLGLVMTVVWPLMSMMQSASRANSRLLNGRTRTATFTEDIFEVELGGDLEEEEKKSWTGIQSELRVNRETTLISRYTVFILSTLI